MSDPRFTQPPPEQEIFSAPLPPPGLAPEAAPEAVSELAPNLVSAPPATEEALELFASFTRPDAAPERIPHLIHLLLLGALLLFGWLCASVAILVAVHFHFEGVRTNTQAQDNVHYLLGSEALLYLIALAGSFVLFPLLWEKSFLAGVAWRGRTAIRLSRKLAVTAMGCMVLASIDEWLLPGPANAPIDVVFRTPGDAWLMFAFGVTLVPIMEETFFRGFLLPALATAWDWTEERLSHRPARPLDANGDPTWSLPALIAASIATSLPFAELHAFQNGHALGSFLLLLVISLVLCAVRLRTRSLAASVLVHACYNFLLFSLMLIGTDGFRHMGKM